MPYPEVVIPEWWNGRSRADVLQLLIDESNLLVDCVFRSRLAAAVVGPKLASPEGQVAAFWLNIYGRLYCHGSYCTVFDVDMNMTSHATRADWYRLVTMPTVERLGNDARYGFSRLATLDSHPALTHEELESAQFWMSILNIATDRFLTRVPLPAENPPAGTAICPLCNKLAATEPFCGSPYHTHMCFVCLGTLTVEVFDAPGRWLKSAVLVGRLRDSSRVYVSPQRINCSICPSCNTTFADTPELEECPSCSWSRFGNVIHSDHRAPPPPTHLRGFKEVASLSPEYFGIELEVECPLKMRKQKTLAEIYDPAIMVIKHDGSLQNGAEIVSSPATFKWWMEHEEQWSSRLDTLRNAGFRSYDSGRCGMHIHIDRRAFTPSSLLKLQELVMDSGRELFKAISQREDFSYCQFAQQRRNMIGKALSALDGELVEDARSCKQRVALQMFDRRVAVNVAATHATVELRLFRGTLNVASFWKNIECAKALLDFVSSHSMAEMTAEKFTAYVAENAQRFRHLQAFLTKLKKNGPPKLRKSRPLKMKPEVTEQDFADAAC